MPRRSLVGGLAGPLPLFAALALLVLVSFGARGAAPQAKAIEEVRRSYAQCGGIRDRVTPVVLHKEIPRGTEEAPWQRSDRAAPERAQRTMSVFAVNGMVRFALDEVNAVSGDWRQTIEHCFRADGSVAFVFSTLRTFYGNVAVEDRLYFDPRGKNFHKLRRVSDLGTGKPVKRGKGGFMDQKPELFGSSDELLRAVGREKVFPR